MNKRNNSNWFRFFPKSLLYEMIGGIQTLKIESNSNWNLTVKSKQ